MKSIAEYFRDLAADDRYFGAEPPQPDAEMLHQIAEREIKRRVEARVSEHGVILRQATDDEIPATGLLTGTQAPAEKTADDEAALEARRKAAEAEAERQAAEIERQAEERRAEEEAEAKRAAEEVAARKAAEEEAARQLAEEEAARLAEEEAARIAAEKEAEREAAEEVRRAEAEADAARRRAEAEAEAEERRLAAEAEAAARREAESADEDEDEDDSVAVQDAASVTDRIRRIHAVVDNTVRATDDYSEDEHAEDYFRDDEEDGLDDILEQALVAEEEDEVLPIDRDEDETAEDDVETAEDDDADLAALLGKVTGDAGETLSDEPVEPAPKVDYDEVEDDDMPLDLSAYVSSGDDEAGEDAGAAKDEAPVPAPVRPQAPAAAPRRPIARVVRVRRPFAKDEKGPVQIEGKATETPKALAPSEEPYDPDEDDFTVPGESSLDPDAEAALIAELAEVERTSREAVERGDAQADFNAARAGQLLDEDEDEDEDDAPHHDALDIEPEEEPADRIQSDDRRPAHRSAFDDVDMGQTDRAIDRILEKTNSQLATGESTRRRNAIQHLKAAVQAKRADRDEVNDALDSIDPTPLKNDEYRDDLARVVRPRRPSADSDRPKRRLAPLVLVSEQRVDADVLDRDEDEGVQPSRPAATVTKPARPVRPVRPRRVGKSNLAMQDEADEVMEDEGEAASESMFSGFRAFAADLGVEGIEDSIEAAAAFVTQEVGRPWATRPQVISLALDAAKGASREEALASFSNLLKAGQILKVNRGQFVLSEDSAYYE